MIPAAAQTLAEMLTQDSALIRAEIIDFNHPQIQTLERPVLNLYCYHLNVRSPAPEAVSGPADWLDLFFLISALDTTALGAQQLLSEALLQLLPYSALPADRLVGGLQGHRSLPMKVLAEGLWDPIRLWTALGVPLRPAIHVVVTVPFCRQSWHLSGARSHHPVALTPASGDHSGPGPPLWPSW